jgi:hypothetical protein
VALREKQRDARYIRVRRKYQNVDCAKRLISEEDSFPGGCHRLGKRVTPAAPAHLHRDCQVSGQDGAPELSYRVRSSCEVRALATKFQVSQGDHPNGEDAEVQLKLRYSITIPMLCSINQPPIAHPPNPGPDPDPPCPVPVTASSTHAKFYMCSKSSASIRTFSITVSMPLPPHHPKHPAQLPFLPHRVVLSLPLSLPVSTLSQPMPLSILLASCFSEKCAII